MTILEAFFLGIFQGVTEFLPISSSGHLVLAEHFFGFAAADLIAFDALLHGGTLLAVMLLFRKEIWQMLQIPFAKGKQQEMRFVLMLIAATIPAAVCGILFEDWFTSFRSTDAIAIAFILTGFLFVIAERFPAKKTAEVGWRTAIIAGFLQIFALLPGVSRSGITMAGSMLAGTDRAEATRFSFFLGIPITAGVVALYLTRIIDRSQNIVIPEALPATIAFVSAVISGYLTAKYLLIFFRRHRLTVFAVYLIGSGVLLLIVENLR